MGKKTHFMQQLQSLHNLTVVIRLLVSRVVIMEQLVADIDAGHRIGKRDVGHEALRVIATSRSRIAVAVLSTVSGLSEMLSMPCSTRNWANSG